jgi:hypothetical protein
MARKRHVARGAVLRVLAWAVSILLLLVVGALTLADWALRQKYEPTLGQVRKDVTDHASFFCEQQTLLARDPWFHAPRTEGDAGPLLNARLPWDPSPPQPRGSPLTIPAHLPQNNLDFKDWLTSNVDVSTLDFSWMEQLHAYDRWDILNGSPIPSAKPINWASAPIPNFVPLVLWAKFRLLHGLKTGKPVEAGRDVRQLAWLTYRTDMLLGGAMAYTILLHERQAYDSMPAPPAEWHPMSTEQLDRMRAIIMSSPAFSHLAAPVEVARQARSCGEPAVSRCIALTEAGASAKLLQPLAQDKYRDHYEAFASELTEHPCSTSLAQTIWERGTTIAEERGGKMPDIPEWLNTLPGSYAGSRILGILLAIGTPPLKPLKDFQAKLDSGRSQPPSP